VAKRLPELRIHYHTLGKVNKDSQGKTTNAVLIMHGTTGSGAQFIRPEFAGELSAMVSRSMPRNFSSSCRMELVTGKSSKPSDGLPRENFPRYGSPRYGRRAIIDY